MSVGGLLGFEVTVAMLGFVDGVGEALGFEEVVGDVLGTNECDSDSPSNPNKCTTTHCLLHS